jgi:hypothetical protein
VPRVLRLRTRPPITIPAGYRVKTDRRDAKRLVRLYRAAELSFVAPSSPVRRAFVTSFERVRRQPPSPPGTPRSRDQVPDRQAQHHKRLSIAGDRRSIPIELKEAVS